MQPTIDENKLNEFIGRFVGILALWRTRRRSSSATSWDYKAMADSEPVTAEELAERTGTDERYMQEWLGPGG
jgi:hypothetical protein